MAERQELPDDVPCGANCLKSGLRHSCVKSTLLADMTCIHGLFTKDARMLGVLWNAMCIGQVIHDGAPPVCFFFVDFTVSFGASTNPHVGILFLFPTQDAAWSQHKQYTIPTPFGRCLLASTMCRGDPLLIGLERPVTTELPLYCVRVQFVPQCLRPCVVLSLQTRNRCLQLLDTIPDKLVGRNRSTFPAFLRTAGARRS